MRGMSQTTNYCINHLYDEDEKNDAHLDVNSNVLIVGLRRRGEG